MKRRGLIIAGLIAAAALLAFVVQGVIRSSLIIPIMYALHLGRAVLSSISQLRYWQLIWAGLLIAAVISLAGTWGLFIRRRKRIHHQQGPIESLADNITNTGRGVYYRWLVAHQLSMLARQILIEQEGEENVPPRSLAGQDWNPPQAVQEYLEAGLERWVVYYPARRFRFKPPPTPLDANLDTVVAYLESQMETDRER